VADETGVIESVVGGGDAEAAEAEKTSGLDPLAAGLAAQAATAGAPLAPGLEAYLEKQRMFVELQTGHLLEQGDILLSHLKLRRAIDLVRLGLQLFFVLIFTALGVAGLWLVKDAVSSSSVVIETFDVPPELAARGVTGKVAASGLLRELTRLQAATRGSAQKRHLAGAWVSEVKMEMPEAGISVDEIDRYLRRRFSHDLRIEGDLVQTSDGGVVLTVSGDGIQGMSFTGNPDEMDKLETQAAEYVYSRAQPGLYAVYLVNEGRTAEAIAFCTSAYNWARDTDKPYLLNQLANAILVTGGRGQEALGLLRAAVKLKPDYWVAYNNIMNQLWVLGDEEGAWRAGKSMERAAGGRPGRASDLYYQNIDELTWNLAPILTALQADKQSSAGLGTQLTSNDAHIAALEAKLHDEADVALTLQTLPANPKDPTISALAHFARGLVAEDAGDPARAAAEMEAFGAGFANPAVSGNYAGYNCWIAPAEEAAGHPDKADAVLNGGGTFVDCYRFRGDILDRRGEWAGAQQAYARAVALAPDLPAAYFSWGAALARHGDLKTAEAKLIAANIRGPDWADPLKAWGDLLAAQGRWKDAVEKYDQALKHAPSWEALKRARAAAARKG
jgi:tetratricopeptide (TPR) repeat protein